MRDEQNGQKEFTRLLVEKRKEILNTMTYFVTGQHRTKVTNPDQLDLAAEFVSRERRTVLLNGMESQLDQIESALLRINKRTYGYCTSCGNKIPEERLKAMPYVSFCLECQERRERIRHR